MADTKYGKHIVPIPVVPMTGEGNGTQGWDLWGSDLGGWQVSIAQRCFKEPGRMNPEYQQKPHVHAFDEILFFLGSDTSDLTQLGSVAELRMGKEEEKHIISTPTAVWVPKGLLHCPITFLNVDKPCLFGHVAFSATRPGRREPK